MQPTSYAPPSAADARPATPPVVRRSGVLPALTPAAARATLLATIGLGLTGDALFFDGIGPGAFCVWILLLALNVVALADRAERPLTSETLAWLGAATAFAFATVWRNSDLLVFFDIVVTIGCLVMAGIRLREPDAALFAPRFRNTLRAALHGFVDAAGGFLPLVVRELPKRNTTPGARTKVRGIVRALAAAAVMLFVFGSLLREADPVFASFLNIPFIDLQSIPQHVFITLASAWFACGWIRSALARDRDMHDTELPDVQLASLDIVATLGALDVLFALFVLAQFGWIFGGEAFLLRETGLTAAAYARRGFFQMAWVVALVVPVLVFTRSAVRTDRVALRRHTMLAVPLLALLSVMIFSAALRMKMYVHYFGLTTDRLYPLVFMGWLAVVLAWLSATVLRDRGRTFIAGAALSGLTVLGALNVFDPDLFVARENVARAATLESADALDVQYLASLRGRAVELATAAVLAAPYVERTGPEVPARCAAARLLLDRWGVEKAADAKRAELAAGWRFWNHDDVIARRVVAANRKALHAANPPACWKDPTKSNYRTLTPSAATAQR